MAFRLLLGSFPPGTGRPGVPPLQKASSDSPYGPDTGRPAISRNGGRGKPLPYGFPEMTLELGRGAPWVSRRGIRIRPAGGPVCRPYGVRGTSMTGGSGTRPYGVFTNGSAYKKRDRFRTCPLKPRGEAKLRTKFLCLLSFSKKVRGSGGEPEPLTCVCCKGEGEMGDMYDYWVR